jgi:hypothetical protein
VSALFLSFFLLISLVNADDSESSSSSSSSSTSTSSSSESSSIESSSSSSSIIATTTLYIAPIFIQDSNLTNLSLLTNPTLDDCAEYRSFYTSGNFDILGNFTWDIHSELGQQLGCYFNVFTGTITDGLDNIADTINDTVTTIVNLPSTLWDKGVNGLDSGFKKYFGFGLDDVLTILMQLWLILLLIIYIILGLVALTPVLLSLNTFLIEGIIIILAFGDTKRNPTAWEQLKAFVEYNVRWFSFAVFFAFSVVIFTLGIIIVIPDYIAHAIASERWQLVTTKIFKTASAMFMLALSCLTGKYSM